ncbi:MAG: ATP-binding cassette domain-containing protein [Aeromonas sp.]
MLSLDNLCIAHGAWQLQLSGQCAPGTVTAILGHSGAGKSTLLAALGGFVRPERGVMRWAGQLLNPLAPAARPITTLFQDHNLFDHLTVAQNIGIGLTPSLRLTAADHAAVQAAAARVGLAEKLAARPAALSGGQQQRVALARTWLRARRGDKPLVLLDEPFSALDPALSRDLLLEFSALAREAHCCVLLVTHQPGDAQLVADQIWLLEHGQLTFNGPPAAFAASTGAAVMRYWGRSAI